MGTLKSSLITCNPERPVREAHPNSISAWIKSVIARAYKVDKDNPGPLLFRATLEIRAQSVSYAWYANVSVEQIVKQCRWTQHSTFTNFYLREVAGQQGEILVQPHCCPQVK